MGGPWAPAQDSSLAAYLLEGCAAGRGGTLDEVATVGALLMGQEGAFITGSDFLMDGGATADYGYGDLAPQAAQP